MRNCNFLGPYSRTVPRARWWFKGGVLFLVSEVPLHCFARPPPDLCHGEVRQMRKPCRIERNRNAAPHLGHPAGIIV